MRAVTCGTAAAKAMLDDNRRRPTTRFEQGVQWRASGSYRGSQQAPSIGDRLSPSRSEHHRHGVWRLAAVPAATSLVCSETGPLEARPNRPERYRKLTRETTSLRWSDDGYGTVMHEDKGPPTPLTWQETCAWTAAATPGGGTLECRFADRCWRPECRYQHRQSDQRATTLQRLAAYCAQRATAQDTKATGSSDRPESPEDQSWMTGLMQSHSAQGHCGPIGLTRHEASHGFTETRLSRLEKQPVVLEQANTEGPVKREMLRDAISNYKMRPAILGRR